MVTNNISNHFSNHFLVNFTKQYRTTKNKKPHKSEALQCIIYESEQNKTLFYILDLLTHLLD